MLLDHTRILVKERVAVLKLTDVYDLLDPESGRSLGEARDEPPGWAKFSRLLVNKHFLPTTIHIYEAGSSAPLLSLRKRPGFLRTTVVVADSLGAALGSFRSKLFSLGGAFFVFDPTEQQVARVQGDWKGWNFRFLDGADRELGTVSKKWAGLGKEMFTTADTYMIALDSGTGSGGRALPNQAALLLAAGLAIDIVFKERS